jgi:hypothetical protein
MKNTDTQQTRSQNEAPLAEEHWAPQMPIVLHTLSNKLLPIMAFSDLGSRRCDDPQLREYFEKINQAASDSREFIIQLRQQFHHSQKDMEVTTQTLPDE